MASEAVSVNESVARLGSAILSRLSLSAILATTRTTTSPTFNETNDKINTNDNALKNDNVKFSLGEAICSTCQLKFQDYDQQRQHYKSDYHRFNQQRKLSRRSIVTEEEFENMSDMSSIEGSDSDSSTEENETPDDNNDSTMNQKMNSSGSSMIEFPLLPDFSQVLIVYKALLVSFRTPATPQELVVKFQQLQKCKFVTLFMTGAGHFAGAVFDVNTGKALVHKTIHRYTTRRKQGGSQSANDKSKGNANSAGAALRRYNEMALEKEINDLIISWKDQIQQSSLIFLRSSQSSRKAFYANPNILKSNDERIRGYPFTTRRATYAELQRTYKELFMIQIANATIAKESNHTNIEATKELSKAATVELTTPAVQPQQQVLEPHIIKILDFTKRGKNELLTNMLDSYPESIKMKVPDSEGTSLLHIASLSSQSSTVELLLTKYNADPCVKNMRNLRPYDVASDKDTRNAFRRVMYRYSDLWDWKDAHVPSPLSPEMEEEQKAKDKAKKAAQREKEKAAKKAASSSSSIGNSSNLNESSSSANSSTTSKSKFIMTKLSATEVNAIGMSPEARARLDREKRAMAAEARLKSQQNQCANCKKSLKGLISFDKLQYRYCSTECIRAQQILHT